MSESEIDVLLKHHLKALKLPTILREYQTLSNQGAKEGISYGQFLLRLTERELLDREQRASERRIREAKFPVVKTLDTFDFKAQPSLNERTFRELMRCE